MFMGPALSLAKYKAGQRKLPFALGKPIYGRSMTDLNQASGDFLVFQGMAFPGMITDEPVS